MVQSSPSPMDGLFAHRASPSNRATSTAALAALVTVALLCLPACAPDDPGLPTFHRWGRIELIFQGPPSASRGEPNPFDTLFDVMFTAPDGSTFLVPGFYDGDGAGGPDGNVWKVRFAADENGAWSWHSQSSEASLNGLRGRIGVIDPPPDAPDFYHLGRLEYVDRPYLKFREGGYWIKSGADEPENLLGAAFGEEGWDAKKRQIDYLATTGVNSVYVMTHNLGGDDQDVWPWLGAAPEEAKRNSDRFDVRKLARWLDLFEYIQAKGIVIHLVLEDDSAWSEYDHRRYYREIVARFGYLPALYFNFGEEFNERYTIEEALGFLDLLKTIDPYDHPRGIHNVNLPLRPYLEAPAVSVASVQTQGLSPASLNARAAGWLGSALALGQRPLVIGFDEARPADDRQSWWSAYLGGAVWESILPVESAYEEFSRQWLELVLARRFMESLPAETMFPANHLVKRGTAFCLARPGSVYAAYLPDGGAVDLELVAGNTYRVQWFNPRAVVGEPWRDSIEMEGGLKRLEAPDDQDWSVRIERVEGQAPAPPSAVPATLWSVHNEPVAIRLAALPLEQEGPLEYEIVRQPRSGALSGAPPDVVYTPRAGFTGTDGFEWRVESAAGLSNVAAVTLICNAAGVNTPPRAYDASARVAAGGSDVIVLRATDRDGPGPIEIHITKPPEHGTVSVLDQEATYTPEPGFTGRDSFEWQATDGAGRSEKATARITVR